MERCSAQDPTYIIDPDAALTRELIELGGGHVVTMTIAPEKPGITGDDGVNAALIGGGALPSFGHTDSEAAPVRAALADAAARIAERIEAGKPVRSPRSTATHLFNGMRPMHHRAPGPVPEFLAAAARGRCIVEMIGDGVQSQVKKPKKSVSKQKKPRVLNSNVSKRNVSLANKKSLVKKLKKIVNKQKK